MNRFFSFLLMALLAFSVSRAAVVTFNFSTAEGITAMGYSVPAQSSATNLTQAGPVTVDGVTLSATNGSTETRIWNSQGNYTLRIYVDGSVTFSVAQGSITTVTVNAANTSNFDLIADVGEYSATGAVGSWTGSAASVTFTHVGAKNAQVASFEVTTSTDGPGDDPGDDPIDPNIEKLDSIHHLDALADGTPFQFTSDVYVNYQWQNYLWVMQLDDEGEAHAGLIYGDTGKQYALGSVIPAGWTGTKSTYKGLVEVTSPSHFKNAKNILDEYYYSAFDGTGFMHIINDPEQGWVNYKVYFEDVHLGNIDEHGNFMIESSETDDDDNTVNAAMAGYNKFGIDYPEPVDPTELYSVEGMVTLYNGTVQFYPISITSDPGTRLWKVVYEGEDHAQYKINDTLYVAATVESGDRKLVFVTDNVDQIYYDTYAEWGYAEWLAWYPDWIALDCSDNEEFYSAIATAQALAPLTVKGTLEDRLTNPRLVLNSAPVALDDIELPELTLFKYDLTSGDYVAAVGHEVGQADGYYRIVDGQPYLCSKGDSIMLKLNFDYAPRLADMMAAGMYNYGLLCIFTLDEPWGENIEGAPMHRIHTTDEDYFTNYTVYPLAILSCSAVDEVVEGRRVLDVKYVSPAGVVNNAPHEGVNIVVTTFGDGTRTTMKRMGSKN